MPKHQKPLAAPKTAPLSGAQRLNKVLAASGFGSRRDCEELILSGRVEIDGNTITDLATKVDSALAEVKVDGTALRRFRPVYYVLNKPSGVLCTNRDPSGRTLVTDLLPAKERVFSVGRLDRASEGLMLLTNDGELAQRLAHPRFGVQKTYFATVQGEITDEELAKLKRGVRLAEGYARVDGIKVRRQRKGCAELEIVLSEGKNREIRRILARLGHKVMVLRRLAIGSLRLGTLPKGGSRALSREEVAALYACTNASRKSRSMDNRPKRDSRPESEESREAMPSFDDSSSDEFLPTLSKDSRTLGSVLAYDENEGPSQKPRGNRNRGSKPRVGRTSTPATRMHTRSAAKNPGNAKSSKPSSPLRSKGTERIAKARKNTSVRKNSSSSGRPRSQKRR